MREPFLYVLKFYVLAFKVFEAEVLEAFELLEVLDALEMLEMPDMLDMLEMLELPEALFLTIPTPTIFPFQLYETNSH